VGKSPSQSKSATVLKQTNVQRKSTLKSGRNSESERPHHSDPLQRWHFTYSIEHAAVSIFLNFRSTTVGNFVDFHAVRSALLDVSMAVFD